MPRTYIRGETPESELPRDSTTFLAVGSSRKNTSSSFYHHAAREESPSCASFSYPVDETYSYSTSTRIKTSKRADELRTHTRPHRSTSPSSSSLSLRATKPKPIFPCWAVVLLCCLGGLAVCGALVGVLVWYFDPNRSGSEGPPSPGNENDKRLSVPLVPINFDEYYYGENSSRTTSDGENNGRRKNRHSGILVDQIAKNLRYGENMGRSRKHHKTTEDHAGPPHFDFHIDSLGFLVGDSVLDNSGFLEIPNTELKENSLPFSYDLFMEKQKPDVAYWANYYLYRKALEEREKREKEHGRGGFDTSISSHGPVPLSQVVMAAEAGSSLKDRIVVVNSGAQNGDRRGAEKQEDERVEVAESPEVAARSDSHPDNTGAIKPAILFGRGLLSRNIDVLDVERAQNKEGQGSDNENNSPATSDGATTTKTTSVVKNDTSVRENLQRGDTLFVHVSGNDFYPTILEEFIDEELPELKDKNYTDEDYLVAKMLQSMRLWGGKFAVLYEKLWKAYLPTYVRYLTERACAAKPVKELKQMKLGSLPWRKRKLKIRVVILSLPRPRLYFFRGVMWKVLGGRRDDQESDGPARNNVNRSGINLAKHIKDNAMAVLLDRFWKASTQALYKLVKSEEFLDAISSAEGGVGANGNMQENSQPRGCLELDFTNTKMTLRGENTPELYGVDGLHPNVQGSEALGALLSGEMGQRGAP
ncbi:unnamed protein product [Amoebophrya sp. A120]|nr:unnamed protein product [Amoebophrya sp. A120]|eukprot:GSA120T00022245001.1